MIKIKDLLELKSRKAQISLEYLTIVGFVLVMVTPMLIIYYQYQSSTNDEVIGNQVYQIGQQIVDSAESMYYLGNPSKSTIKVHFPSNIRAISAKDFELVFNISTRNGIDQVVIVSEVNISGTIPITSGIHFIGVQAIGDFVEITST